jgi:NNP family nitrate/nitrite transporter-like MFS transporter
VLLRAEPHLRAFWTATFGFFSCFFSVFAPAALSPHLRKSVAAGGIGLTGLEGANAQMAAVGSTIVMRLLCGPIQQVGRRHR